MADAALNVLGLAYGSDSDDSDVEEETPVPSATPAATAAVAAASIPPQRMLPSADDLLSDLPNEVDWNARTEPADASYDKPGTNYNAVRLPTTMSQDAARHNRLSRDRLLQSLAASDGASQPARTQPGQGSAQAQRPKGSSGKLLPPQLRRPNVATEDLSAMRTAKRSKPAE